MGEMLLGTRGQGQRRDSAGQCTQHLQTEANCKEPIEIHQSGLHGLRLPVVVEHEDNHVEHDAEPDGIGESFAAG